MAETLQNLALGFSVALQPAVLLYAFVVALAYGGAAVGQLFVRRATRPRPEPGPPATP